MNPPAVITWLFVRDLQIQSDFGKKGRGGKLFAFAGNAAVRQGRDRVERGIAGGKKIGARHRAMENPILEFVLHET